MVVVLFLADHFAVHYISNGSVLKGITAEWGKEKYDFSVSPPEEPEVELKNYHQFP
jgi:hypothetical protein